VQKRDIKSQLTEVSDLVTGQFAISYVAFFISRFGIVFALEAEITLGNPIWCAFLFTVIAEPVRLLVLILADRTYLSDRDSKPASVIVVLITWLFSAAAGSVVGGSVLEAIPAVSGHLVIRVIPSAIFAFSGFALITVIASVVHRDRVRRLRLTEREDRIRELQTQSVDTYFRQQRIEQEAAQLEISKGLSDLRDQIEQISALSGDQEILKLINAFDTYGVDVIRRTSHDLVGLVSDDGKTVKSKTSVFQTLRYFSELDRLNVAPKVSLAIIFIIGALVQIPRNGIDGAIFIGGLCVGIAPLLFFAERYFTHKSKEKAISNLLELTILATLTYICAFLVSNTLLNYTQQAFAVAPAITAFRTTLGIISVSIAFSFLTRQQKATQEREELIALRELEVTAIDAETIRMKREFAQILHGSVQGKIASISMSLKLFLSASADQAVSNRDALLVKAKEILMDLSEQVRALGDGNDQVAGVTDYLLTLQNQYAKLVSINYEVSPLAQRFLTDQKISPAGINEILANAVTNSLRHGLARNIQINLSLIDDKDLKVTVQDDGLGVGDQIRPGLGLNHILSMNAQWKLENVSGGGTRLDILIFPNVSKQNSANISGR
jgi:signal transduction histidine kinase